MAVTSDAELREVYRPPAPRAAQKALDHLDVHCRNFIELSPFCVLSSSNAADQIAGADAREIDADEDEANRERLY